MAARATEGLEDAEQIASSCAFLAQDLVDAVSNLLRNGGHAYSKRGAPFCKL